MADNSTYAPSTVGSLVKGTYSMACTPNLPSNDLRSGSEIGVCPYLKPKWYDMGTLPTLPPLTCCMLLQHECFILQTPTYPWNTLYLLQFEAQLCLVDAHPVAIPTMTPSCHLSWGTHTVHIAILLVILYLKKYFSIVNIAILCIYIENTWKYSRFIDDVPRNVTGSRKYDEASFNFHGSHPPRLPLAGPESTAAAARSRNPPIAPPRGNSWPT